MATRENLFLAQPGNDQTIYNFNLNGFFFFSAAQRRNVRK